MSQLARWLAREARRQGRRTDPAAALLSGTGVAYARQRLAPVWLRSALRLVLHACEIYLLCSALPADYLAPLLGYRAVAQLANTAHWGALEPLRRHVRELQRLHQARALSQAVARWMRIGVALGALPALWFGARLVSGAFDRHTGASLFDAYAFACFARAAAEVYTRTYHAGIYALRRVYRPLFSLIASDLLELLMIVTLFDALGPWCIALAILASGALDALWAIKYARIGYRLQRLEPPRFLRAAPSERSWQRRGFLVTLCGLALPALAHTTTQLDGLLLVLLLQADPPRDDTASLALAYYVLRPLFGFAAQWVRTFYFDLSRLERGALSTFRGHLGRYLRRIGLACACAVVVIGALAASWLWPALPWRELAWLVPWVFVRALFAQRQLEAFVRRRYLQLSLVAAPIWLVLIASTAWGVGPQGLLNVASVALLCGYLLLPAALEAPGEARANTGLAEWLSAVRSTDSLQLAVMGVARTHGQRRSDGVIDAVLGDRSDRRLTHYGHSHVLLASTGEQDLQRAELIARAAGRLCSLWISARSSGCAALTSARARGVLPLELDRALSSQPPAPPSSLLREFRSAHPDGCLIDLRRHSGHVAQLGLSRAQLSQLTTQIVLAAKQRESARRNRLPVQVAVFAPGGEAQLVFIVPRGAPGFAAFRARVRAATLQSSWSGAQRRGAIWLGALMRRRDAGVMQT